MNGARPSAMAACLVFAAATPGAAQQQEPHSARVYCLKVAADRAAEFEALVRDAGIPAEKQRMAAGESTGFDLLRAVIPSGSSARCDYLAVFHYGLLPEAEPGDKIAGYLERAGLGAGAAQDAMKAWSALTDLVSLEWWWWAERVGSAWPRGSYVSVAQWTIEPNRFPAFVEMERSYFRPLAQAWREEGGRISWDVVGLWAPGGTSVGYSGMTINVYHDWETMMDFLPKVFGEIWPRVFPNLDGTTIEDLKLSVRTPYADATYRLIETTTE